MRRIWLALAMIASGGCGGGGGDDGAAGPDANLVTPPGTTCGAPVTAVDTSSPDHVVGDGAPGSCTETALAAAIALGGSITFACGPDPTTITVTATLALRTDVDTTGAGLSWTVRVRWQSRRAWSDWSKAPAAASMRACGWPVKTARCLRSS